MMKSHSVLDVKPELGKTQDPRAYDHETAQVAAVHQKFDLGLANIPTPLSLAKYEERAECLGEELREFIDAFRAHDFAGAADALVDLVVFAKGTAVLMGLPWARLFDDVMLANNAKVRGIGHRGHAVDLVKPPGWCGPQTEAILETHGWKKP